MRERGNDDELDELVARASGGDEEAWQRLWTEIEPRLDGLLRKGRFLGPLAGSDDDRRAIVVEVFARLRSGGFARLKTYLEARQKTPGLRFFPWIAVVSKRVAIDHLRAHPNYLDRRRELEASSPGRWVDDQTLPSERRLPAERPPLTDRGTAAQLLRFAGSELPAEQRRALELWLEGQAHDTVAAALGLSGPVQAERLVRAALERLRRHFRY